MVLQAKTVIPPFSAQHLEAIARVLGDTDDGLSGSEIGYLLADCRIGDPAPGMTKWKRLFNAFVEFQNRNNAGNHVLVFIRRAMNPASYTEKPTLFVLRRNQLNAIIAFAGYELNEKGEIIRANAAATLTEAMQRVNKFHAALKVRDVHPVIYDFCTSEILAENYFHAVFEAMKSITSKIRTVTGLPSDGAELVQAAFQLGKSNAPLFAINRLSTETERGEQRGFVNLLIGLYGTVRNPLAHDPKVEWDMTEQDALDIMSILSLVHRKLDKARRYEPI
jgi:uncharacterized protein (TIGR02391 family)